MTDLDAAWWAKLRRASTHRGTLRGLADEFQASDPYTLNPEPGERPNEVAYRLRIRREAPAEISTVVGDVLHNLRSALDSLAYELAVQSNDAALTKREREVTYFPWFPSLRAYEAFFGLGDEPTEASRLRGRIYGPEARKAMQAAQPFWWTELATNMSTSKRQQLSDEDFMWSAIYRLQKLNNIDKHRRLPALGVGWPEMFYWGSDEGDDTRFRPGHSRPPTTRSCATWSGRTRPTSNYRLSSRWCLPMTRGTSRAKTTAISLRTAKSCWRASPSRSR